MNIDEKLKKAGLLTVDEIMSGQQLDGFIKDVGVKNLVTFKQWLDSRVEEMLKLKVRLIINKDDPELLEWVSAHCAAFYEVRVNLNAAYKGEGWGL